MTDSLVQMDAADVLAAANECMKYIDRIRDEEVERMVKDATDKAERSWFRRLFRRPMPARMQVIEELSSNGGLGISDIQWARARGGASYQVALRIHKLASKARDGRMLLISSRDLVAITSWIESETPGAP